MSLLWMAADDRQGKVRAAAAEAGEILDPVIRLGGDEVQAWMLQRLTIGERGAERSTGSPDATDGLRRLSPSFLE